MLLAVCIVTDKLFPHREPGHEAIDYMSLEALKFQEANFNFRESTKSKILGHIYLCLGRNCFQ